MNLVLNKRQLSIGEIVKMQNQLNSKADPKNPNWRAIRKREDFLLAAFLEFAELIESTPWKWWKHKPNIDIWNLKIEAIDILHFLSSILLLDGLDEKNNFIIGAKNNKSKLFNKQGLVDRTYALNLSYKIIQSKNIIETINELMQAIGLAAEELSAIYVAKYALNEIRWSSGYADGTYKKKKTTGIEDNVFLQIIVENFQKNLQLSLQDVREQVFKKLL